MVIDDAADLVLAVAKPVYRPFERRAPIDYVLMCFVGDGAQCNRQGDLNHHPIRRLDYVSPKHGLRPQFIGLRDRRILQFQFVLRTEPIAQVLGRQLLASGLNLTEVRREVDAGRSSNISAS